MWVAKWYAHQGCFFKGLFDTMMEMGALPLPYSSGIYQPPKIMAATMETHGPWYGTPCGCTLRVESLALCATVGAKGG